MKHAIITKNQKKRPAPASSESEKYQRGLKTLSDHANYDTTKISDRLNQQSANCKALVGFIRRLKYEKSQNSRRDARSAVWWSWPGLNRRPRECHSRALPTAPQPHSGRFRDQNNMENCDVETTWHANTQYRASQPTNRRLIVRGTRANALDAKYHNDHLDKRIDRPYHDAPWL